MGIVSRSNTDLKVVSNFWTHDMSKTQFQTKLKLSQECIWILDFSNIQNIMSKNVLKFLYFNGIHDFKGHSNAHGTI